MIDYINEAKNIFSNVVEFRRLIHKFPELSFQEYHTTDFICKILDEHQIEYKRITETGVVATIGKQPNCIALRADIDALPISEETNLPYSSVNNGVMHACGHDMHTSMLIGTAIILKKYELFLKGTIKLIFQPGEEKLPGGAKLMIESGVLDNPKVLAVFGQHINPQLEVGNISISGGPIMASTDEIYITINGVGAHAAQPHLGNDIITTAANLIVNFQSIITKFRNPIQPAILSITSINGGNTTNIFPEELKMMGTMRTFNAEIRAMIKEKMQLMCNSFSEAYNCKIDLNIVEGYPALINDVKNSIFIKNTASSLFGNNYVSDFEPKMWAEDFAYFAEKVPSVFWFLGVKQPDISVMPGLHNPKLNPNEDAMINGIALMVKTSFEYLDSIMSNIISIN